MAQIGTMTTGAGVVTSLNLPYCPQYLIINDTYLGTFDLTNIDVSINGQSTVSLIGADDIDSVAQLKSHSSVADGQVMMSLELANGEINAPTLITIFTTTNHQPWVLPDNKKNLPIPIIIFTHAVKMNKFISFVLSLLIFFILLLPIFLISILIILKDREYPLYFSSRIGKNNKTFLNCQNCCCRRDQWKGYDC